MDLDLENGGGGNNAAAVALLRSPDPADPQRKELQPCTWLRAAPYIVAMLAGVALFVVGAALEDRSCSVGANGETINNVTACHLGIVLSISGAILAAAAIVVPTAVNFECNPRYLPRLDQADD
jgi:hypothetical protein